MTNKDKILVIVDAMKEASKQACPAPWHINTSGNPASPEILTNQSHPLCRLSESFHRQIAFGPGNDAEFIVMARNTIPTLLYVMREMTWVLSDIADGNPDSLNAQISADSALSRCADAIGDMK